MFAGYPIEVKNGGDIRFFETDNTNFVGFVAPATIAADKLWTLPNADGSANYYLKTNGSGVLSFAQPQASEIGGGAALTKSDDTNVTLTLGGTPTTALLVATSLTLGWTGTLSVARGGTGAGSFTANGVLYGNTTGAIQVTAQGAANTVLIANAGAPSFSGQPTLATGVITKGQEAVRLDPHGAAAGNTGELRFLELAANGTHYFGLKAPDSLVASTVYVLPTAFPAANGYVLTSTTAGVLAWAVNGAPTPADLTASTGISITAGSGTGALLVAATLAVDQTFTPTWSGQHTFTSGITMQPTDAYSVPPAINFTGSFKYNAAGTYRTLCSIQMGKENVTDGNDAGFIAFLTRVNAGSNREVGRFSSGGDLDVLTGITIATAAASGNVLQGNGTRFVSTNIFANPSGTIGLSVVNGSSITAMRSDATPALSQAIAPTWTGLHEWKINNAATGGRIVLSYDNTVVLTGDVLGSIDFKSYDSTASCAGITASIRALAHVSFTANPSTDLILCVANTTADIDNPVERFRLDSTGKVLIGTGGVTFGGLSVTVGLGNTVARFGDGTAGDVCAIPRMGSSGAPALAFNAYNDGAWKFGKGSSANYGQVIGADQSNGTFTFYVSNATGNADAALTLATAASLTRAGVFDVATGFTIAAAAASGNFLRGNGTNFVSSAILAADVPSLDASKITTGIFDKARLFDLGSGSGTLTTSDSVEQTLYSFTAATGYDYMITAYVAAMKSDSTVGAGYMVTGAVRNNGGTLALIGATQTAIFEDDATWNATLDVSGTSIRLRVQGATSTTINWKGDLICTRVSA